MEYWGGVRRMWKENVRNEQKRDRNMYLLAPTLLDKRFEVAVFMALCAWGRNWDSWETHTRTHTLLPTSLTKVEAGQLSMEKYVVLFISHI